MELQICMIPSPEDPPLRSDGYQSELRDFGLIVSSSGLEISDMSPRPVRAEYRPAISGEWRIKLKPTAAPLLRTPVHSWLQARRGRIARLKIGEIETDVRTVDEFVTVIQIANRYQEASEQES
jgi:hypothetical protein